MSDLKFQAEWRDDCQGKKDYDGDILSISTRYWPRGGGFSIIGATGWQDNPTQKKPSATSELLLRIKGGVLEDSICLSSQDFEAETEEEVKTQMERWAQDRMDEIVGLLRTKYKIATVH